MTTTKSNIKQLDWVPSKGERRLSVDISKVKNLGALWTFVESLNCQPELVSIRYNDRTEVHLMVLQEYLEPGTPLKRESNSIGDQLEEFGVPDEAIRHCYGGEMVAA